MKKTDLDYCGKGHFGAHIYFDLDKKFKFWSFLGGILTYSGTVRTRLKDTS